LQKTSERRDTINQMNDATKIIERIAKSQTLQDFWARYQKNYPYAMGVSWNMAMEALQELKK